MALQACRKESGDAVNERLTAALSDRYQIERELGAGGIPTVYLAHDNTVNRPSLCEPVDRMILFRRRD